jgi:dTDP-4-dehydrorhamnose reductase
MRIELPINCWKWASNIFRIRQSRQTIVMPLCRQLPEFENLDRFGRLLESQLRLPLLVTGIAGVAGYNSFAFFRHKYGDVVVGQRPKNNWPLSGPGIVGVDLEDEAGLRALINDGGFKTVLNCGGSCALKSCELDPHMARRVNVDGVRSLLKALSRSDVRLVHLSIDLVFSGTRAGNHRETDETDPVTVYGATMVEAEQLILEKFPAACILRISLPMGISFNGHAGAIDWIQSRFAAGKPATLYFDEIRTPTYVECLNETLEEVICSRLAGVYHAGGPRRLSLFQIAQIVNVVGGYDPDLLQGCYRIEAGPIPPRAGNVTMNNEKLSKALRRKPFSSWPLNKCFIPCCRQWHYEARCKPGSMTHIRNELYFRPNISFASEISPSSNHC